MKGMYQGANPTLCLTWAFQAGTLAILDHRAAVEHMKQHRSQIRWTPCSFSNVPIFLYQQIHGLVWPQGEAAYSTDFLNFYP